MQNQHVNQRVFNMLCRQYCREWHVGLCYCQVDGQIILKHRAGAFAGDGHLAVRKLAIDESLRWGEPAVQPAPDETVVWAVPVMLNQKPYGGLVAGIDEAHLFRRASTTPLIDVRAACTALRKLAEEHNLTNAALLESRRRDYLREQTRAEAIHANKAYPVYDIRALYLMEEPAIIAAVKKGDRNQAREILNHLLVAMIHRAGGKLAQTKSFFMELVVMLSRTAVDAGGAPDELLGRSFDDISRLAEVRDDEDLALWLHEILERIMASIRVTPVDANEAQLAKAMRLISGSHGSGVDRDTAAEEAGMSRSHFSRLFRRHFGRTFSQTLLQSRVDHASELLLQTDKPLKLISLECGFADQSHLTKAFRQHYRTTPLRYRREHKDAKL